MPGVFDLRDVFELVVDRLNDGTLPRHDLIEQRHQFVLHVRLQFSDELKVFGKQRIEELLRDVALVAKQFAKEGAR